MSCFIVEVSGGQVQRVMRDTSGKLMAGVVVIDFDTDGDLDADLVLGARAYVSHHCEDIPPKRLITRLAKILAKQEA